MYLVPIYALASSYRPQTSLNQPPNKPNFKLSYDH